MPRKTKEPESDGPSTADVSADEDVDMQNQDTKMSGFKKFGVSAIRQLLPLRMGVPELEYMWSKQANNAVAVLPRHTRLYGTQFPTVEHASSPCKLTLNQDSDTNPNTTASSVAGDMPVDGRKKRAEAMNMRKSIYGKKHDRLGASKVRDLTSIHLR